MLPACLSMLYQSPADTVMPDVLYQDAAGLPDARLALAGSSASNAMHKRPQLSQADRAPKRSKLG